MQRSVGTRLQCECHQPDGTANANIFGFSGCVTGTPSVRPKLGEVSTPRILGLVSGPPTGVAGEPEDVGDVAFEKVGEGVSGVLGSAPQATFVGVPGAPEVLVVDAAWRFWAKPGTGLVVLDVSSKGVLEVEASALAARLETKVVG